MSEGSIVTFYSYKGGVGRTLALANIGALLCRWGYKVLCVDWDLEAPGLQLYFAPWVSEPRPGLTELIQAQVAGDRPDWRQHLTQVHLPAVKQPLALMTAGIQDGSYVQRMQALDWARLYEEHQLGNFLEALRGEWKAEFDLILIDSRTGITDIGGICTVQLPDLLVLLFTANMQSLRGSIEVARRAQQTRNRLPFDRAKLLTLPVATRFEMRVEYELAQQWLKIFADELRPLFSEWAHKDVTAEELLNFTRVPYIPFWSFGEKLPVIEKGTDDLEDLGFPLETLAALVAQRFAYSDVLVRNRDSFVASARQTSAPAPAVPPTRGARPKTGARLFISYSHKDEPLRQQLEAHLKPLIRQGIIQIWHDRQLASGERWREQIDLRLEEADIILPLVSADYLASDYTYEIEMRRALEKHAAHEALLMPVILRPVDWQSSPLALLQALPPGGKPVTSWADRDAAWVAVVKGIQAAAQRLTSRH